MSGGDNGKRSGRWLIWASTAGAIIVGLSLRNLAASRLKEGLWHDVVNELGIALVIAAVVTLLYEFYARQTYSFETVQQVLRTIMGDMFDTQLWEEMKAELLSKSAMRRAFRVELRVERRKDLPPHILVLRTVMSYRLTSLRRKKTKIRVLHFVDQFMTGCAGQTGLPRFERITVGETTYAGVDAGTRFERQIDLASFPHHVAPVAVEREELVYIPGAYNLLMSELTELESLVVVSCPDDVVVDVNVMFVERQLTTRQGWSVNRVLLPGQSLEFRFRDAHDSLKP